MEFDTLNQREQGKLRRQFQKDCTGHLRALIRGTCWRKTERTLFLETDEFFVEANIHSHYNAEKTRMTLAIKPMAVDPVFWQIMSMPDNNTRPLSFRANAAFKCWAFIFSEEITDDHGQTPDLVASMFFDWANQQKTTSLKRLATKDYSHFIQSAPNYRAVGAYAATLVCTLICKKKQDLALEIATQFAKGGSKTTTFNFYGPGGSFFDRAIDWINADKQHIKA